MAILLFPPDRDKAVLASHKPWCWQTALELFEQPAGLGEQSCSRHIDRKTVTDQATHGPESLTVAPMQATPVHEALLALIMALVNPVHTEVSKLIRIVPEYIPKLVCYGEEIVCLVTPVPDLRKL